MLIRKSLNFSFFSLVSVFFLIGVVQVSQTHHVVSFDADAWRMPDLFGASTGASVKGKCPSGSFNTIPRHGWAEWNVAIYDNDGNSAPEHTISVPTFQWTWGVGTGGTQQRSTYDAFSRSYNPQAWGYISIDGPDVNEFVPDGAHVP